MDAQVMGAEPGQVVRASFPTAAAVYVMGTFNNWSTLATPLTEVAEGLWEAALPVGTELRDVLFFVWEQGQKFGRVLAADACAEAAVSAA